MQDPSGCVSPNPVLVNESGVVAIHEFEGSFCFRPETEEFVLYQSIDSSLK
jgi:hypothetical protein